MMQAWAAEVVGEEAAHAEPFYASAEFWVAIGFIIFVILTARTVFRVVTVALDDRADRIKAQIDEATRLADEAQDLLASYERKQQEASEEAREIVERARREADRLTERATEDLERALKRREELAMERLAQAEQAAVAEVRSRAVDVALAATANVLAAQAKGKKADALIDATIQELPEKLKLH